ncbi:hypothetical protein KKP04_01160 [Rhodomicrobium sp. Az07]|uniref:GH39 family glycosyl hydrolase n=1 Tax=Rhodomicrobium sp. Az07 TaxID=2839034 RepID=UPI001BE50812|nr:hypothetical protein [Rhodomicrobium sp. Az07]MBT3069479.1 hypothetical protein [Rhodomicrobium sp. Az07]
MAAAKTISPGSNPPAVASAISPGWHLNRLRYGFNEIDGWPGFAFSDNRHEIYRRLRLMNTEVVRLFVFDKPVPCPFKNWRCFAAVVDGVLASGAKPMITFAKFEPPYDSSRQIERFVSRVREVVWCCLDSWGGDEVKDWQWCVWNEPNNPDVGGNLSYPDYLRIYRAVAEAVFELVAPHVGGARVKIGGPSIDGTQRAYWLDWIARLLDDVGDDRLAFVNWHMYADWRPAAPAETVSVKLVDDPPSPNGPVFEALTMACTPQYEARARSVARLIGNRDISNVCGELNTIAHHERVFTGDLNRNVFGAAYYASAILNLMRGGADLEMRWTATSKHWNGREDAYGLMSKDGVPTPPALAKQILAQHVRRGDMIRFPDPDPALSGIDAVIARDTSGRLSAVLVNTLPQVHTIEPASLGSGLEGCGDLLRLDSSTCGAVVREAVAPAIRIEGCGLVVVSEDARATVID